MSTEMQTRIFTIAFVGIFIVAGLGLLVIPRVIAGRKRKRCTVRLTARIVELDSHISKNKNSSVHAHRMYCPIVEYQHRGRKYRSSDHLYTREQPVSEQIEININSEQPEELYIQGRSDGNILYSTILGVGFLVLMIPILLSLF